MESTHGGQTTDPNPDREDRDLLSLDEAAQFLGTSATTLYRLLKQNDLNGLKVGRQWRFRKCDLAAYLERSSRTAETVPAEALERELAFFCADAAGPNSRVPAGGEADTAARRLADGILRFALNAGASDIHLEPVQQAGEQYLSMRMRVDGSLQEVRHLPLSLHPPLLKRLKNMAGIDLARTIPPLEGRFHFSYRPSWQNEDRRFEIPVSCLPTTRGEDITIRLCLPPVTVVNGLDQVEMAEEQQAQVRDWLRHPHGLIVSTGLGRQKQFLFNCLLEVSAAERKTIVLEEYQDHPLPYAASVPIHRQGGTAIPELLRAVHNHDPDVIMLEAADDAEVARLVHELAFTEYLVLTSVPASGTARAVHWFLEQQMEPLVVARTLIGLVAQWQARRICPRCKEPVERSVSDPVYLRVQQIAAAGGYEIPPGATFYHGRGCERCHRGCLGTVHLFEVMTWNDTLTDALLQGASPEELTQVAVNSGMRTLLADGLRKAVEGHVTLNEVLLAGMATI